MRFASIRTLRTQRSCRNPLQMRILWSPTCKIAEFVEGIACRRCRPTGHRVRHSDHPRSRPARCTRGPDGDALPRGHRIQRESCQRAVRGLSDPSDPAGRSARRRGTSPTTAGRCLGSAVIRTLNVLPTLHAVRTAGGSVAAPAHTPQADPITPGGQLQPSAAAGAYGVVAGRFSSAASGRPICGNARCGHAVRSHTRQPAPIGTAAAVSWSGSPWEYTSLSA